MKFISLICLSFFLLFACKDDQSVEVGAQTSMVFKSTVFNAGTVYKGEVIRAVFEVENTGEHPLVFGEVRPSCSCTVANAPKKPLQPGKRTKIVAEVNTDDLHTKRIHKAVTVMTNTSPNITVLEIKGRIK
ncbi:MAG: hypothetical protein RI948_847 [Bacteroidota bacterium]|jgi:hypothetical protein